MAQTTEVRDRAAKKMFFSQIPHLVRLLPIHPFSKLLYWDLKAIADQFANEPEVMSDMLKGKVIAKRLGISAGKISECKRELVAFGLIEIEVSGINDVIWIEDIWDRNRDHFTGSPDPMIDTPPAPAKTERKYVRKADRKARRSAASQTTTQANVSPPETLKDGSMFHHLKHDVSLPETLTTTETGSNNKKEVQKERKNTDADTSANVAQQIALTPQINNPAAAPNAPPPPSRRKRSRKSNLHSAYPLTIEQEPRLADARIIAFNEIFGREKLLAVAEIDDICARVLDTEAAQWRAACVKWSTSVTTTGNPYRITGSDSIGKLISFHVGLLRVANAPPRSSSAPPTYGKPTIGQLKAIPAPEGALKDRLMAEATAKYNAKLAEMQAQQNGGVM